MPLKITKKKAMYRKRRGLRRGYRRRVQNSRNRVNDTAGVSETIDLYAQLNGAAQTNNFVSINRALTGACYTTSDIQLTDFVRASSVARNYQFYKIKYVEISILPDMDTFTPGGPTAKPYLYYQIDKAGAIPTNATNITLKTSGCKPIALDEKPIHIRFKPAALLAVNYASGASSNISSAGMYRVSPMLMTTSIPNSSTTPALNDTAHQGMKFFVENNGSPINYAAQITCHFQFFKPLVTAPAPQQVV